MPVSEDVDDEVDSLLLEGGVEIGAFGEIDLVNVELAARELVRNGRSRRKREGMLDSRLWNRARRAVRRPRRAAGRYRRRRAATGDAKPGPYGQEKHRV
jgi:hypothetical protein